MKKRVVGLLLAGLIGASVLTGCEFSVGTSTNSNSSSSSSYTTKHHATVGKASASSSKYGEASFEISEDNEVELTTFSFELDEDYKVECPEGILTDDDDVNYYMTYTVVRNDDDDIVAYIWDGELPDEWSDDADEAYDIVCDISESLEEYGVTVDTDGIDPEDVFVPRDKGDDLIGVYDSDDDYMIQLLGEVGENGWVVGCFLSDDDACETIWEEIMDAYGVDLEVSAVESDTTTELACAIVHDTEISHAENRDRPVASSYAVEHRYGEHGID